MSTTIGPHMGLEYGYSYEVDFLLRDGTAIYDLVDKTVVLRYGRIGAAALFELELDVNTTTARCTGTVSGAQASQTPGTGYEYHVVVVEDEWLAIRGPSSVRDTLRDI